MNGYTKFDRKCACLTIEEDLGGPGSYTSYSCKLDKFNSDCKDCIGCEFSTLDVGTTQSRVMLQLSELGF